MSEQPADESHAKSATESNCPEPPARTSGSVSPGQRFAFIDGLRGLAALSIAIFHIWWYEPEPYPALESASWIFDWVLLRTRGAVQVLLVISGFVIAYTLRNSWVTRAELASFIGRRIVRLVPPYWVTIAIVVLADVLCSRWLAVPRPFEDELSTPRVLAHITFTQDVFGHPSLSAGMWTVCIEMQFYLVAVLGWGLAQQLFSRPIQTSPRPSPAALVLLFGPLAVMSLLHWHRADGTEAWVTHFLWFFLLGMTTWWALDGTVSVWIYIASVAGVAGQLCAEWQFANAFALATSVAIFTAGRLDRLHIWMNWPWLQYLAKISYSLYLIHYPVSHLMISMGWKWYGNSPTSVQASAILFLSLCASIGSAYLLYVAIEAPCVRFAAAIKHRTV